MSMTDDDVVFHCPTCDADVPADEKPHDCPEAAPGGRDGRCAMCGAEFDDFLAHLKNECDQRGEKEEIEEPEPAEAATADDGIASWQKHPMFHD
jgi:hypothetical protein